MNASTPKHQFQHAVCGGSVLCVMPVISDSWKKLTPNFIQTLFTHLLTTQTTQVIRAIKERAVRGSYYDPGNSVG